jgi:hypothetical protein
MTLPWNYGDFAFLIPAPDETVNIDSVIKPFQWPVTLKQDGRRQQNSSRYYRPYNNQISGLVGNSHFHGLRHRRYESNAALLGISIPI